MSLYLLEIFYPRLSVVQRPMCIPRKAIRLNIVVSDSRGPGSRGPEPELLLDVHFGAHPMTGADLSQAGAPVIY